MIMKKNMMLAGLIMMSTIVFAQHPNEDRAGMATKRADKMKTQLSLSDDQYAKVKVINEKFAASHVALRKDTSITIGTSEKRREQLKKDHEAQLKKVLTDAQWTKWTALRATRSDDKKKHGHGRGGHGHGHDGHGKSDKG